MALHTVSASRVERKKRVEEQERVQALYRKYGPAIYSRCRRLLRDDTLAEDATQEVFVRVLRHIEQAPADTAVAWIYRISTNYCLNVMRDQKRQAEPTDTLPEQASEHPEPQWHDRSLTLKLIERAPESLRGPAVLYYLDGFEQEQVAKTLGISRRTVINRLQDFVDRSKKFLARGAQEGSP